MTLLGRASTGHARLSGCLAYTTPVRSDVRQCEGEECGARFMEKTHHLVGSTSGNRVRHYFCEQASR